VCVCINIHAHTHTQHLSRETPCRPRGVWVRRAHIGMSASSSSRPNRGTTLRSTRTGVPGRGCHTTYESRAFSHELWGHELCICATNYISESRTMYTGPNLCLWELPRHYSSFCPHGCSWARLSWNICATNYEYEPRTLNRELPRHYSSFYPHGCSWARLSWNIFATNYKYEPRTLNMRAAEAPLFLLGVAVMQYMILVTNCGARALYMRHELCIYESRTMYMSHNFCL